jgi:mono/diheme cytochrome c family protein
VARGHLHEDTAFYTGRTSDPPPPRNAQPEVVLKSYVTEFPLPVTTATRLKKLMRAGRKRDEFLVLERGQERFNIFCAVCHDRTGSGDGMIPRRGFTRPPSFHTSYSRGLTRRGVRVNGKRLLLRDAPVGYYFDVITNGYGAMADYASQVPPRDRWAIIAYIRALQFSQRARETDLRKLGLSGKQIQRLKSGGQAP